MKTLVIFYSLDGNTKKIAKTIAETVEADILELRISNFTQKSGFMKMLWGGWQVIAKKAPKLIPFKVNPLDYDLIFIGTPVWAGNFSSPIRSLTKKVSFLKKNIALFCCHGGGPGDVFEKMRQELGYNVYISDFDCKDPSKTGVDAARKAAAQWSLETLTKVGMK